MKKSRAEKKPASMQRDLAERFLKKGKENGRKRPFFPRCDFFYVFFFFLLFSDFYKCINVFFFIDFFEQFFRGMMNDGGGGRRGGGGENGAVERNDQNAPEIWEEWT